MKKLLLFWILVFGGVLYSSVSEVNINNKALDVKNGLITFNGENYTGIVRADLAGGNGYFTLKNGYLSGQTDLKLKDLIFKFNVPDGYFDGETVIQTAANDKLEMLFEKHELKKYKINSQEFTLNINFGSDGRANGEVSFKTERFRDTYLNKFGVKADVNKLVYKNGSADLKNGKSLRLYIDKKTKKMVEELVDGNTSKAKFEEDIAKADLRGYQEFLIRILK